MTRVDFYLLEHAPAGGRDLATCKLAHKAFRLGHRIYILTPDSDHAAKLDQLLWTFSPGTFVPHGLNSDETADPLAVVIGSEEPPPEFDDVLMHRQQGGQWQLERLAGTHPVAALEAVGKVPDCFSRFQRVAEIVDNDAEQKQHARTRFRFYRERGYPLQTHNM